MPLNEYLKAQNKTNEIIIANNFTRNELDRFSASDFRWADNRTRQFQHRQVKKGKSISLSLAKIINLKCPMSTEVSSLA